MYKKVNTFGRYLRSVFGEKVYKIPVSISGFSCPNIDGTKAKGGCTYCDNESFSPNLKSKKIITDIEFQLQQLENQYIYTKKILSNKFGVNKFIIYFQSFSNTFADLHRLQRLYEKALSLQDVVGISIGTRTDCIDDEKLSYISKLSKKYEVWIEYGIQTIHNNTLDIINRADTYENTLHWIEQTKRYNINICGHIILGLPNETKEMMSETINSMYKIGIDSIKIHPLYVVKNTSLANDYKNNLFNPISKELYIELLVEAIVNMPKSISIQRITAGIDNNTLLTPLWCRDKNSLINEVRDSLKQRGFLY
jgi:hypothetical protein